MESAAEIQNMRVSELKEFLKRNGVDVTSVKRSDGKAGQARKSDLLGAAMHVRADYDAPEENGPTSPDKNMQPNVFQSGYSPRRRPSIPSSALAAASAQSSPDSNASPQVPPPRRISRKKVRRSSVGWVNPAFLAQITPKKTPGSSSQNKASPAVSTPGTASKFHHDPETYAQDFGDSDDQVIQSDYDSTAGSGVESDSSVIETDEEDESSVHKFRMMKAYEVRAWLSKHNVPYNHRSKKAELISLASAHAMYLETIGGGGEDDDEENENAEEHEYAGDKDDEVEIVESGSSPPPSARERRNTRRPRIEPASERKQPSDDIEPDTRVANPTQSSRRPQRRRIIAAPENEEDIVTAADSNKPNVASASAAKGQAPQSTARPRRKRSPPPRREFRLSILLRDLFYFPRPKITRQSVKGMTVLMIITLSILGMVRLADEWTKPFCDTNDIYGHYKGKECRPCPAHGICQNGELECERLYRREGRICVEDSAVSKYANYLEKSMLKVLVEKKGARDCNPKELFEFDQNMLKDMFLESNLSSCPNARLEYLNRRNMDVTKFPAAFEKAMSKLRDNREIVKIDAEGRFSAHEGRRTFSCSCRLFVWNNIWRCIGVFLLMMLVLRWRVKRFLHKRELARIEDVYNQALEVLRGLRINYSEDDKGDAFMRDTELRVELLGRSTPESIQLWAKVEKLLQADTRVLRSGPRSINGHPCYVYEWRGNIRRSFSGSLGRDHGIRNFQQQNEESRRRLSFGSSFRQQQPSPNTFNHSASPQNQPHTPSHANYPSSPQERRNPLSPDPAPSPGYQKMLSLWRNQ